MGENWQGSVRDIHVFQDRLLSTRGTEENCEEPQSGYRVPGQRKRLERVAAAQTHSLFTNEESLKIKNLTILFP